MRARKKRKKRPKRKTGKITRSGKRKRFLGKIVKLLALFTGLALALYLAIGFWLGFGAIKQDIEGKVAGASTVLTLHIAGPPGKPMVSISAGCNGSSPYIFLDWDATTDTDSYDVYRGGSLLASGLTNTHYRDENVTLAASYNYYVIANGPLGSTQSDTVFQTAPSECYVPPPPPPGEVTCRITRLNNIDLANFRCLPKAKKKRPIFFGTANVSGAQIQAEISSRTAKRKVVSSFSANENGYWSWGVQGQLKKGVKTISVKATDPNDASRWGTCALRFKISRKGYSRKKMKKCTGAVTYQALSVPPGYQFSPSLQLRFKNYEKPVFAGDSLGLETDFGETALAKLPGQRAIFQLIDSKNNLVHQIESGSSLDENGKVAESFKVPLYLKSGQYRIIAQLEGGGEIITAEKDLKVKEKPLIELSPTWSLTYAEFLSKLGWVVVILIAVLVVFLGFLFLEYHLSQYAVFQVTEKELKKDGYID